MSIEPAADVTLGTTHPDPEAAHTPDVSAQSSAMLANRIATMELRLRLMETAEPDDLSSPAGDEMLGLLRPRQPDDASAVLSSRDPFDERALARSEWAADALQSLTELLARSRAQAAATQGVLDETASVLGAEVELERARAERLELALTHVYAQAQAVQHVVGSIQSSRSYRLGHRFARIVGRPGPAVSRYETPIADDISPHDVALVLGSGVFDRNWYLATYPDVADVGADPLAHFMTQSRSEHRCPGPLFDTGWYLREYGDLIPPDRNPLAYYLTTGWRLGHRPWAEFDPEDYVRIHPEIAGLDVCPLVHRASTSGDG